MEISRGNKLPRLPDLGLLGRQESFPLTRAWHVETASCIALLERTAAPFQKDKQKASYSARFKGSSAIKPRYDLQGKIWEEML